MQDKKQAHAQQAQMLGLSWHLGKQDLKAMGRAAHKLQC